MATHNPPIDATTRIKNRRVRREVAVQTSKRKSTEGMTFAECVEMLMNKVRTEKNEHIEKLRNDDIYRWQQEWFCGLHVKSTLRSRATTIVRHSSFQFAIVLLIILNTIGLAMYDPMDNKSATLYNQVLDVVDGVFNLLFTIELILKMIAVGFLSLDPPAWALDMHKNASKQRQYHYDQYEEGGSKTTKKPESPWTLRPGRVARKGLMPDDRVLSSKDMLGLGDQELDSCCCGAFQSGLSMGGWNNLDLFVVVFAWFVLLLESIIPGMPTSLTSLRALRSLKILRTGRSMPKMKAMVDDVLASIPLMANVAVLLGFIFFIFGLAGTRFFGLGAFRQQCWVPTTTIAFNAQINRTSNSTTWSSNGVLCGGGVTCNANEMCHIYYPYNRSKGFNLNPGNDFVGFDNIGVAFLTIFQCLSLEGWVDVMYAAQDTVGWWVIFFFVPLIIIGALFVMQLTLAVVANNYHSPEEVIKKNGLKLDGENAEHAEDEEEDKDKENGKKQMYQENKAVERRNVNGCDQSHSSNPELWDIEGTEMDWHAVYTSGSHLWYIQTRAHERYNNVRGCQSRNNICCIKIT